MHVVIGYIDGSLYFSPFTALVLVDDDADDFPDVDAD